MVVSATNRLDGRQYAIKKIKILHSAASYYSRMMREVATLSRLQHPNVVRYFQVLHAAHYTSHIVLQVLNCTKLQFWLGLVRSAFAVIGSYSLVMIPGILCA